MLNLLTYSGVYILSIDWSVFEYERNSFILLFCIIILFHGGVEFHEQEF